MAVLSVSRVALTSLQTFFKYSERAERHKTAAVQIGEVRRELEQKLQFAQLDEALTKMIREKWNAADRQSPTIPTHIYERIENLVRKAAEHKSGKDNVAQQGAPADGPAAPARGTPLR